MKDRDIWFRVLLLALWAGAANLWCYRHLGFGFDDPVAMLGITAGPTAFFMALDRILGSEDAKGFKRWLDERVRGFLRAWVLTTPVLVLLYFFGLVAGATISSVTIVPPRQGADLAVEIAPIGSDDVETSGRVSAGGTPLHLWLATNPFGRDLRLTVKTFVPQTITLFPLTGMTVDPEADLQKLPTLLFRPSIDALAALAGGGSIRAFRISDGGCTLLTSSTEPGPAGALMLGPERPFPSGTQAMWHLELRAQDLSDADIANALLKWNRPATVTSDEPLEPGDLVYVTVVTRAGKRKTEALATVGREAFQDIRIDKPAGPQAACGQGT